MSIRPVISAYVMVSSFAAGMMPNAPQCINRRTVEMTDMSANQPMVSPGRRRAAANSRAAVAALIRAVSSVAVWLCETLAGWISSERPP